MNPIYYFEDGFLDENYEIIEDEDEDNGQYYEY